MENENASGNVNMSNLLANLSVVLTYLAKKSGDQNNKNNKNAVFRGNNNYVRKNSNNNIASPQYLIDNRGNDGVPSVAEHNSGRISNSGHISCGRISGFISCGPISGFMCISSSGPVLDSDDIVASPQSLIDNRRNDSYVRENSDDKNNKNAAFKDSTTGDDYNTMGAPSSKFMPSYSVTETHLLRATDDGMKEYLSCATGVSSPRITGARVMRPPPSIVEKKKEDANLLDSLDLLSVVKNLKGNEKIARLSSLIIQLIKENGGHVPGYAIDPTNVRVSQVEKVETLTQFTSHENSSNDEQTIKVK